ncbi:uncharacterized protein LOC115244923 isoform X2 [Formica exsecta]|uniref:uncharacterized protein LOC115244923 isoform X2 n=1 Tax=Formica exsecta TaxID=72781 RepID=UPI0011446AA6|nr:uncharacterized protein LOC115244923 isoform X2 [Formica exsecta]
MLWYKRIVRNLDAMLLDEYLDKYGNITIDVNIDGLPVTKSTRLKFWPVLGRLVHTDNDPFLIGLYVGEWDPIDVHSYLNDFVAEVEYLLKHRYMRNGDRYPSILRNFFLDAPARSLVKCCVGHNGYGACEKCTVVGQYIIDRMIFLDLDAPLRTDESFRNQDDQLHHIGVTILLRIAKMFIVVKFLPTQEDDDLYYEVALAKWIVQIDKNMSEKIFWPKNDAIAGKLVRSETRANETWPQLEVEVKKYYETYIAARNVAMGFEEFASAYESDSGCQMGRGMRRKRFMNLVSSDDDSSSSDTKKCKQDKSRSKIPTAPLPPPPPAGLSFLRKSLNIASKENITPLTIVSNKKQSKTAIPPSAAPITAGTRQNKLLHKIINLRQQAADKAQQRKKAMSLENIRNHIKHNPRYNSAPATWRPTRSRVRA